MRYLIFIIMFSILIYIPKDVFSEEKKDEKKDEKKYSFIIKEKGEGQDSTEAEYDGINLSGDVLEWFEKAKRRFDQGEYDDTILYITKVIERVPEFATAYHIRGMAYIEKGKKSKARLDDDHQGYDKYVYEFQQAVENFSKVIQLKPRRKDAYLYRGMAYRHLDHYAQPAIDDLDKYINEFGIKTAVSLTERGYAFYQRGYIPEAIEDFHAAIGLDVEFKDAFTGLIKAYEVREDYDDAIDYFNILVALYPDKAMPWFYRGLCFFEKGNKMQAIWDFQKALSIYPDYQDAKKMLEKALGRK
jgi:tetratricopeptide (TPR) repeat protein